MTPIAGACIVSVPKAGTMFLTRSLERIHNQPCLFGLAPEEEISRLKDDDFHIHPNVSDVLNPSSPPVRTLARRYAKMAARNRANGTGAAGRLFSDHGMRSFPRFLLNPTRSELRAPALTAEIATAKRLRIVFLHRDIRTAAASLVHFLCLGKSYLVRTDDFRRTGDVVATMHAPILAEMIALWKEKAKELNVMLVAYERLIESPHRLLSSISDHCRLGKIDDRDDSELVGFRPWTYRRKSGPWHEGLSDAARAHLEDLAARSDGETAI